MANYYISNPSEVKYKDDDNPDDHTNTYSTFSNNLMQTYAEKDLIDKLTPSNFITPNKA